MKIFLLAFFFVPAAGLALAAGAPAAPVPAAHSIDHIGIGAADLDKGIAFVAEKTSVTAVKGGVHPGRGTQNALMSLSGGTYLEIIAPIPGAKPLGVGAATAALATPKPEFFAVRSTDLEGTIRMLREKGFAISDPEAGSRKRPDGSILNWRTAHLEGAGLEAAPFIIEWDKTSPHPSATSPSGCTLAKLEIEDKNTKQLSRLFGLLGLDIPTHPASASALRVTLSCSKGQVVFGP
jgi:hypothetical protein